MEYLLIGVMDLDFETRDGKIDGVNIFVGDKADNVVGYKTEKKFIQRDLLKKMGITLDGLYGSVNKKILIYCDLKGKLVLVQLPKAA